MRVPREGAAIDLCWYDSNMHDNGLSPRSRRRAENRYRALDSAIKYMLHELTETHPREQTPRELQTV